MVKFLDVVKEKKIKEVEDLRNIYSKQINSFSYSNTKNNNFSSSIKRELGEKINIISEIKPKSPSTNNISEDLDEEKKLNKILELAKYYSVGGARAFSILTDKEYFGGGYEYIRQVSSTFKQPILQKEFIIDPVQLIIGKLMGADAALILTYYYSIKELNEIIDTADKIGLEAVVECSIPSELEVALSSKAKIILLNNRPISNLLDNPRESYLVGSVENASIYWNEFKEVRNFKSNKENILISASCIKSANDISKISKIPFDAALIGNAATSNSNPSDFISSLISESHNL